jgi:hypothetical protein
MAVVPQVTTALQVFVQRVADRPEDSAALISFIRQALVTLDAAQLLVAGGGDREQAPAAGPALYPPQAAKAETAAESDVDDVLPGMPQQGSGLPSSATLQPVSDAWLPSYWDVADPDVRLTAEDRHRQQRMHSCLAAVTPALSMLVRAHPEAALGLFGISNATKAWLLEHGLPKALLAKGCVLLSLLDVSQDLMVQMNVAAALSCCSLFSTNVQSRAKFDALHSTARLRAHQRRSLPQELSSSCWAQHSLVLT